VVDPFVDGIESKRDCGRRDSECEQRSDPSEHSPGLRLLAATRHGWWLLVHSGELFRLVVSLVLVGGTVSWNDKATWGFLERRLLPAGR
jgi:hypothetical protein